MSKIILKSLNIISLIALSITFILAILKLFDLLGSGSEIIMIVLGVINLLLQLLLRPTYYAVKSLLQINPEWPPEIQTKNKAYSICLIALNLSVFLLLAIMVVLFFVCLIYTGASLVLNKYINAVLIGFVAISSLRILLLFRIISKL